MFPPHRDRRAGNTSGGSRRGRYALKPGIPWKGENLPLGLDFGELIEGTNGTRKSDKLLLELGIDRYRPPWDKDW